MKEKLISFAQLLKDLREDLERLRTLSDTVRKREIQKLRQQNCIQHILQRILYPFHPVMRTVFENVRRYGWVSLSDLRVWLTWRFSGDPRDYFLSPVSKADVPDYYDIIKRPMSWSVIDKKLSDHVYLDLQEFKVCTVFCLLLSVANFTRKDDIYLVLDNAMLYNKPETPYFKTARRIKTAAERALPELYLYVNAHLSAPPAEHTESSRAENERPAIGDLEPPLRILELLRNAEEVQGESQLVIDKEPVESLFSYEFAVLRRLPPPPPPPSPPPAVSEATSPLTRKRDRRAERERAKERRASAAAALTGGPPRTRRAKAAAGIAADELPSIDGSVQLQGERSASSAEPGTASAPIDVNEEPPTKRRRGQKRAATALVGHSGIPPVVDDVDNHKSFDMFDEGWILPEGHRRHNRTARPLSDKASDFKKDEARSGKFVSSCPRLQDGRVV